MLRSPAVSGRFYPSEPEELSSQVERFCTPDPGAARCPAIACLVPHAGYRYSGHVAGAVYARLALPRRFVLIGPRHYPRGAAQAILSEGAWQTPLGRAEIDADLAAALQGACAGLVEDDVAHRNEHALEVQLPFLQKLVGEFRFVPIALGTADYAALESLGNALAEVLARRSEPVLIVASSDMNHYESDEITRRKDALAIDRLLALDPRGLYETVRREAITMCGYGPAVSTLVAAGRLGARPPAELVRYATSGDINGDRDQVVGYAGMVVI
jgi:AmmeMemoRadiSam system protein B